MTMQLDAETVQRYLAETVRVWLGVPLSSNVAIPELPERLGRLLLRAEEYESSHRDQWGNWEFGFSENHRRGCLWVPELDRWLAEVRSALPPGTSSEPLWPEGRSFAMCLTHDVDLVSTTSTPRQVIRSMKAGMSGRPPGPAERVVRYARPLVRLARCCRDGVDRAPVADGLELAVSIEHEYGVHATYFCTTYPEDPSRYDCLYRATDRCRFRGEQMLIGDVLQLLETEGFDIGLHGSYDSGLRSSVLSRERQALAEATGLELSTTRQHFLHWDVRTTPRLHEEAGFRVDSSLGFNRNLGFRAGTSLPFHHFDLDRAERFDLLEVPLTIHDGALFRPDCLELDVGLARETVHTFLDAIAEAGGLATLVFHPNNLAEPRYVEILRFTIEYGLEHGAWFASMKELDRWWRERETRLGAR